MEVPLQRRTGEASLIDVLDRVLDKGVVVDAWIRVSVVGIDLITIEEHIVVTSIDTHFKYADALATPAPLTPGRRTPPVV
jgi:hypothetical protein